MNHKAIAPRDPDCNPDPRAPGGISAGFFIALLSALMAFTSLSTDIYLPAMPQMQRDLQGNVELTITGFLIGFAIAQLIWGPISDRIGRRKPLLIGITLFIVGSIGCALSQSIGEIVFWRMFQAFGACTGPMLARAMVRDCYGRTRAAEMLSTLTVIMAIAPIVGPLLGGQIIRITTWHAIFWLLAAVGMLMLLCLRRLPETHAPSRRATTPVWHALSDYAVLLRQPLFMRYTLCVTLFYARRRTRARRLRGRADRGSAVRQRHRLVAVARLAIGRYAHRPRRRHGRVRAGGCRDGLLACGAAVRERLVWIQGGLQGLDAGLVECIDALTDGIEVERDAALSADDE
ncbi:Bcr/CflA subfamily drug resistance transporter [Comamonas sp. BIGb0124]|uniref:Bcr/CflA family efflux MFS transporter n=1 Tax=Comamonas sp. BIGb0124 TaxID=2485130 RepID=UPI000FBE634F|nr:Bcr/CflA family efflux MFS transporter [Comamonas sp. BIGb0124]ROR22816.1 Bcr/CflA subfamily drug resistance transporter [Comamonas sp. BIGb0124]